MKRVIEGEFGRRAGAGRGGGRVFVARSGHLYFDLKERNATCSLRSSWKGQVAALATKPEEGPWRSIAGRAALTHLGSQSKNQLNVEDFRPRRRRPTLHGDARGKENARRPLAAEGSSTRPQETQSPTCPRWIGVVTSPSGAVIRDHPHTACARRFPRRVLVWPVAVQGEALRRPGSPAPICRGSTP